VGPRVSLDGRKISSPPGFDPGPSKLVAIPTELSGPLKLIYLSDKLVTIEHFIAKPSSESHCINRRSSLFHKQAEIVEEANG